MQTLGAAPSWFGVEKIKKILVFAINFDDNFLSLLVTSPLLVQGTGAQLKL